MVVVSLPGAGPRHWFTEVVVRDDPITSLVVCAGCGRPWRGLVRAHCRGCHVTFDDAVLFDAHRRTGRCVDPHDLDLVAVGGVWCRLLVGEPTAVVVS